VAAAQSGYDPSQFHYLNQGGTVTVDNVNDKDDYGDLIEAFRSIGIAHGDRKTLCNAILGILHLGQLTFEAVDARSCRLGSECGADLAKAARFLLGDEEENDELRESAVQILETTLVTKKMNTGKETIDVPRSATEALLTRDAIAKLVYSNLFSHTVQLINEAIDKQGDTVTTDNVGGSKIGTLDIFGFELFEINSFEQLWYDSRSLTPPHHLPSPISHSKWTHHY
jgi:myosin heavy subunit